MVLRIERYESIVKMHSYFFKVNLMHLIKDILPSLTYSISISIKDKHDVWAYTDSNHIKVAFLRTLENISDTGSSKVDIHISQDKAYAYIAIRDFGCGIKDNPQVIFAPFYSTDPIKVGLGLTEARIAMVKIGAEIEVIPQADPGAIFVLKIPLDCRNKPRGSN